MARTSTGAYALPEAPFVAGTVAKSARVNNNFADIGTELQDSLSRSGKGGMLADLPLGGHRLTGLGAGMTGTDAARFDQVGDLHVTTNGVLSSALYIAVPAPDEPFVIDLGILTATSSALYLRASTDGGVSFHQVLGDYAGTYTKLGNGTATPTAFTASYGAIGGSQFSNAVWAVGRLDIWPGTGRQVHSQMSGFDGSAWFLEQGMQFLNFSGTITHVIITAIGAGGLVSGSTARISRRQV